MTAPERRDEAGRCISCGAEIDHHLGCPDDPNPDYEAEAELQKRQQEPQPRKGTRFAVTAVTGRRACAAGAPT